MIDVCGFTVKNVRKTEGREGVGLLCDIFYKGKKVGALEDYGDGSISNVYVDKDHKELFEKARKVFYKHFTDLEEYDDDVFVDDLVQLKEDERNFKLHVKKGFPVTVRVNYNDFTMNYCGLRSMEAAERYVKTKQNVKFVLYYDNENDFKIVA